MTPVDALKELDELLEEEEQALLGANLPAVVSIGTKKAKLVAALDECAADDEEPLERSQIALVARVRHRADRNWFLLKHLRSCLTVVNAEAPPPKTYGRNGLERQTKRLGSGARLVQV